MGKDSRVGTRMIPLLAVAALLLLLVYGWRSGNLGAIPEQTILLLVTGGLLNVIFLGIYLNLHERFSRTSRMIDRFQRELRYNLSIASEEGILRKQGLVRELNQLGSRPNFMEQAELSGADFAGADLRKCNLRGAVLREANLQGSRLAGADMFGADLSGANLSMADLSDANLRSADLSSARLVKAELSRANLQRAELVDANLEGAKLDRAHFQNTRFAQRNTERLDRTFHPSVDDWIRERLDEQGCFSGEWPSGGGDSKGGVAGGGDSKGDESGSD